MGGAEPKDKGFLQKGAKRDPELYVSAPDYSCATHAVLKTPRSY